MNWSKEYLEARMLDAMEGRLSEEQLIQLKQFIQENPSLGDLGETLVYLEQDDSIGIDHSALWKKNGFHPSAYQQEEGTEKEKMSIAKMEGLLSETEEKTFEHLLKIDGALKREWNAVQQTKLIPKHELIFPDIHSLQRNSGKVIPFRRYFTYAAAASVILVLFLNWPSPENQLKTASKTKQKTVNIDQKETKTQIAETNKTISYVRKKFKNIRIEHFDLGQNEVRDCIVQEVIPEVEHNPSALSMYLTQPIVDPIELAAMNPTTEPIYTVNNSKASEPIGIREFVLQKGNEKLFGKAKPSMAEKYTSVTNYLAQSTKIPIAYNEKEDEKVKTTYFKLGFITIERKQTKK
jgi:hypothetical protein